MKTFEGDELRQYEKWVEKCLIVGVKKKLSTDNISASIAIMARATGLLAYLNEARKNVDSTLEYDRLNLNKVEEQK